jgi:hypothetical protein
VGGVRVVVVDGANVVGSRPDGWWRDRGAAARRLYGRLERADLPAGQVVLVVEGAARRGVPEGGDRVRVVHARGDGDDAIVAEVAARAARAEEIVVVTADRALRRRVVEAGASVEGPSWLLGRLD